MDDRRSIWEWMVKPGIAKTMFGPPDFPEVKTPTWEEFIADYIAHYFDDSAPLAGRCFIILHANTPIGQVSYNRIFPDGATELDIWMAGPEWMGKGYGPQALTQLCTYLFQNKMADTFYIAPSRRNPGAIKAYQKAGFLATDQIPEWFVPDHEDVVVLCKVVRLPGPN